MSSLSDITVNGVTIPAARIAAEAQNHPAPKGKPGLAWTAAARALVVRELLLQEARTLGLQPEPVEIAPGQIETPDEALVRQVLDLALEPEPVDDERLATAYAADPDRYRAPPLWEASHILIARSEGKAAAEAVLKSVLARPRSFAELAQAHSACSSATSGGRLGQLGPGDTVPEFERALARMEPGQIATELLETRYGWHILRLDARAEGAVLPLTAVLPRLRAAAEKAAWVKAAQAHAARLIGAARIEGIRMAAGEGGETRLSA